MEQLTLDIWCGKTSLEHSAATKEKTSQQFLKKPSASSNRKPPVLKCLKRGGPHGDVTAIWMDDGALLGELSMLNTGESPNVAVESRLSQILEETPHQKYYLSEKACLGILRRAEKRGKELPKELKEALLRQAKTGTLSPGAHAGSYNGQDAYNDMLVARTLLAKGNDSFRYDTDTYPIQEGFVRRLTPLECERLQGYPDGWTDIGEWIDSKGKKHKPADSPRYKALGNSIALPPWRFVLSRIYANLSDGALLGSLFDGIGGFPLIWKELGGVPVWASEIEEFTIAVTKKWFGDT